MAPTVTRLYQAVMRDSTAPISIRLRRAVSAWVTAKGFPAIDAGAALDEHEVNGARLRVERRKDAGRFTLAGPLDGGTVRTKVTYAESVPGMTGWVVVTVDHTGETETEAVGKAPGFVAAYLMTARVTDGAVHLEDGPVVVDEDEVERFVATLTEPGRRVPVAVVPVDKDPDVARSRADRLAEATAGAAIVARLADTRAQARFNAAMGPTLGVYGGGLRTYVAPFDPATERYPHRHPPMGGGRIRSEGDVALDRAIDGIIGATARRPLPDDVERTLRVVGRMLAGHAEPRAIAEAARPRPAPTDPAKEALRRALMAKTRPTPAPHAGNGTAPAAPGTATTESSRTAARNGGTSPSNSGATTESSGTAARNGGMTTGTGGAAPGNGTVTARDDDVPSPSHGAPSASDGGREPAARPGIADLRGTGPHSFGPGPEGLAEAVAGHVVKELREELSTALTRAATSAAWSGEQGRLSAQVQTIAQHMAALRDLLAGRPGDIPAFAGGISALAGGIPAVSGDPSVVSGDVPTTPGDVPAASGGDADPLAQRLECLRDEHARLLQEYAEEVGNARRLAERVRHLERKLAEAGRPAYGLAPGAELFEPSGLVAALAEAGQRLPHLVIGDTQSAAARLDLLYPAHCRAWAAKAWDALRALDAFAAARSAGEFTGGFYDWCANATPGRLVIPAGMLSMRESQSVTARAKFSSARTFAVPEDVAPGGKVLMEAHVKLRSVGYPAPRLYFHDDSGGATGKIVIGYLGAHLPNTRTN
jgi:hypothetical protein